MNSVDQLTFIRSIPKEDQIHDLLFELLPEMGYTDVIITHERGNKSEDGKDLICSTFDPIEKRKDWTAFVVKKGVVAGTSSMIQDISSQTKECFEFEYKNIIKGLRLRISKVKVVTNRHFSSEAKAKIEKSNQLDKVNIAFWDDEKLVELINEYYPKYWLKGGKSYKMYVERFEDKIRTDNISKTIGISDKKIQKIIDCAIDPILKERVETETGAFNWKVKEAKSIVNIPSNSIIIGEPGAGKSTLFKQLSAEIIAQNSLRNNSEFYPVILTFADLKASSFDFHKSLKEYFTREWNADLIINYEEILDKRNCVIFIDALDELPLKEDKQKALEEINTFHNIYPEIKIVCSSRPSDYVFYNASDLGFRYLEISSLDIKRVEAFLSNYFGENIIKSKRLLKSLKDTQILDKLPATPLTIALITILFDEKEIEIPATITDLYRHFVDLLLGSHKSTNTIDLIEVGIKHRVLCHVAKEMHSTNRQTIPINELSDLLTVYSKERGQTFEISNLLEDLSSNSGLVYINEKNELQFKHLSFQEYFTAYEIFHHRQTEVTLFINDFNNLWWQNVAIFYAGMSKDAPLFLQTIIEKSEPKNFNELITNTAGIGKILQALYNTPTSDRKSGVKRGVENIEKALLFIMQTDETKYKLLKRFSFYQLLQMLGGVFQYSYYSITLVDPLKHSFVDHIPNINDERSDFEQVMFEFKAFLIASILSAEDFGSFQEMRLLLDKMKSKDLSLYALIEMYYRKLDKLLSPTQKKSDDFEKAYKKIEKKINAFGNLEAKVNIPLEKSLSKNKILKEGSDISGDIKE